MATPTEITLANLGNGDLMACVCVELRKLCENIADPNIKADAKRKLSINIEVKPDEKRSMAQITYSVKTTMPGQDAGKTVAYIAMAPGASAIGLFEVESQPPLFEEESEPAVMPLAKKA